MFGFSFINETRSSFYLLFSYFKFLPVPVKKFFFFYKMKVYWFLKGCTCVISCIIIIYRYKLVKVNWTGLRTDFARQRYHYLATICTPPTQPCPYTLSIPSLLPLDAIHQDMVEWISDQQQQWTSLATLSLQPSHYLMTGELHCVEQWFPNWGLEPTCGSWDHFKGSIDNYEKYINFI